MPQILTLILFIASAIVCHSQTSIPIVYEYDAAGNRTARKVLEMRSSTHVDTSYFIDNIGNSVLRIYPNPTENVVHIELPDSDIPYLLRVFSNTGTPIIEKETNTGHIDIDIGGHPSGVYLVEIVIGKEKTIWKIIKK